MKAFWIRALYKFRLFTVYDLQNTKYKIQTQLPIQHYPLGSSVRYVTDILTSAVPFLLPRLLLPFIPPKTSPSLFLVSPHQDIEAKKEAQKEKEIDEQEANASTMQRCRTLLDKDLINTGIYESAGKQSLPLVQLVQQLLRYHSLCIYPPTPHSSLHLTRWEFVSGQVVA